MADSQPPATSDASRDKDRSERSHRDRSDRDRDRDRHHRSHRSRSRDRSHRHRSRSRDKKRSRDDDDESHRRHKSRREDGERKKDDRDRDRKDGDRDRERSHRHRDDDRDRERSHRHKDGDRERSHRHRDDDKERRHHHRSRKDDDKKRDDDTATLPLTDAEETPAPVAANPARDEWMKQPTSDFIDYTQRGVKKEEPKYTMSKPDYRPIIHKNELNQQLLAGKSLDEYGEDTNSGPAYTFGDSGSAWRLKRLARLYEQANEKGITVEEAALQQYGDLRLFDEAREEEMEMERREMYGTDRKDVKTRPTGDLYEQRMREQRDIEERQEQRRAQAARDAPMPAQAALMKAQLRGDPNAGKMQEEYDKAIEAARQAAKNNDMVVLSAMDNRQLAGLGGRVGREVVAGKKGKMVENENMTLEDMLREEKITRGQGAGRQMAERISRDAKFDDNLDYMDENANKLAQRIQKNEIDIKNMAINEFKKVQKALDSCPLCQQDSKPPLAPVISLGTRVFLSLPTEPELTPHGAMIVPIQHRTNMLECDDDEWEEVRNFMKSLVRMYSALNLDVIFYENAAAPHRRKHASIVAVPLPMDLGEVAPAYFKEAILEADEQWSQHRPIIDTLKSPHGKNAFRKSLVKESPYFHVWFTIDGGMGHIVEDEGKWPKGDLFARELLGGMLDVEPQVIKKQGRWRGGRDPREADFKKKWDQWDWTKVLYG
ncbi:CwfJ C-terminus 1-domain-containing protein-like protein [Pyronema omphalodes]|nr:CwfJ C-terminus 1-domain-containing protein-like protein [Pyronema omphalodes]